MVVFRLIGERWVYGDRRAISVKPQEAFLVRTVDIQSALDLDSLAGWALYKTEGRHPGFVNPTVPIDMKSNPQREKMTADGSIVFVKQADLDRQQQDRVFYEGLLEYRKEKGYKGLQKDGADVAEFRAALNSRLNIDDTRDIGEMEDKARGKIDGEQHRMFWALTFEYREVQALREKEGEGRQRVELEFTCGLEECFLTAIRIPGLMLEEAGVRSRSIEVSFDEGLQDLLELEQNERPRPPREPTPSPPPSTPPRSEREPSVVVEAPPPPQVVVMQGGGGMSKEDMESLMDSLKGVLADSAAQSQALVQELQQQFNSTVMSLSNDLRRSATEVQELRAIVQGRQTTSAELLLETESKIVSRLEDQRQQLVVEKAKHAEQRNMEIMKLVESPRNEDTVRTMRKLVADQNDMLQTLILEEASLIAQQQQALSSLEEGHRAGFFNAAVANVGVDTAIEHMRLAQQEVYGKLSTVERLLRTQEVAREEERQARIRLEEEAAQVMRHESEMARLADIEARTTRIRLPLINSENTSLLNHINDGDEVCLTSTAHPVAVAAQGVLPHRLEAALLIFLHHHCDHNALLSAIGESIERMFGSEMPPEEFTAVFNEAAASVAHYEESNYADVGLEGRSVPVIGELWGSVEQLLGAIEEEAAYLLDGGHDDTDLTAVAAPSKIGDAVEAPYVTGSKPDRQRPLSAGGGDRSDATNDETGGATDDAMSAASASPKSSPRSVTEEPNANREVSTGKKKKKRRSDRVVVIDATTAVSKPASEVVDLPLTAAVPVVSPPPQQEHPNPIVGPTHPIATQVPAADADREGDQIASRRALLYQQRVKRAAAKHLLQLLVVECGGDPYAVVDALVWTFQIQSHPYSDFFVNVLEQHNEVALVPAVDLLLDVFYGREVELMLSLCPTLLEDEAGAPLQSLWLFESYRAVLLTAQGKTVSPSLNEGDQLGLLSGSAFSSRVTDHFLAVVGDGGTLSREEFRLAVDTGTLALDGCVHFYHPAVPSVSQWSMPLGW